MYQAFYSSPGGLDTSEHHAKGSQMDFDASAVYSQGDWSLSLSGCCHFLNPIQERNCSRHFLL